MCIRDRLITASKQLAVALNTKGLVNIQYLIYDNEIYVIEVNPRSSRTVPYISKVTGIPMVDLATRCMFGEKLADMGYGTGLYPSSPYIAVKVPIFSFEKLIDVDNHLGPEMKSTGEVLGIASTMEEAICKGLIAAGYKLKKSGGVFLSVRDSDKNEIVDVAKKFHDLGFALYSTKGTAAVISKVGIPVTLVSKIHESDNNTLTLIESGLINYVVSTSSKGRIPTRDSVKIRRKTVERGIPCLTSIDTAHALADCLKSRYSEGSIELVDINNMRSEKAKLRFSKMAGCGNDYIYFDCFDQKIYNPEGLAVRLSDRNYGIGGEGVVLISPSEVADAKMRIFNRDGSEGRMGGNAIRCVGKYLYDHGMVDSKTVTIETLSGIKTIELYVHRKEVTHAKVNMGKADLDPKALPVKINEDKVVDYTVNVGGNDYNITCVNVGNPHCVIFVENVETMPVEKIGPAFEECGLFPEGINVEFVQVLNHSTIKMRVWERGIGETWSCGTGACAAAVAAVENGFSGKDKDITVKLKGGDLTVKYTDETLFMTGNAELIFDGEIII